MSRAPASFKQADVTRAVKGAIAAGWKVMQIEVINGKVVLLADNGDRHAVNTPERNEWDSVK